MEHAVIGLAPPIAISPAAPRVPLLASFARRARTGSLLVALQLFFALLIALGAVLATRVPLVTLVEQR